MMKLANQLIIGLSILMISVSCKTVVTVNDSSAGISAPANSSQRQPEDISLNGKIYSALWQQNAAEFRALCYQAYNIATEIVKEKSSLQHFRPIAIVTDIDETFLDNSPYAVNQALKGKEFDQQSWLDWTSKGEAVAFPGSVEFFNYAASRNVAVFYISNRNENDRAGTIKNLKNLGFPFADDEHVLLMKDSSNKEERRKQVLDQYEIFLLLGDNLSDFSEIFYHKSQAERNRLTDEYAAEFGKRFIVLPNSGYGDWESFMPGYNSKLSPAQKDSVILKNVKGY